MAPCRAFRSRMFLKTHIESFGSGRRALISPYRNTFEAVSSPRRISPPWTRFLTASPGAGAAAYLSRLLSITFGQNVIVVDASVLAVALADDGIDGEHARARLAGEALVAPELVDLEVVSVWRRHVAAKMMPARRAASALADLADLPLRRSSHQPFLQRIWELRHVVTSYDAAYIALAEVLDVALVTADARLSRASGVTCRVDVLN
jgi:predicted nucleic acid-binding protein